MKYILTCLLTALIALGASGTASSAPDNDVLKKSVAVDIPPQQLTQALIALSKQAGIQVLMSADLVGGLNSQGARGQMTLGEAISKLLKGTQLRFHSAGANTVGIRPESAKEQASASSPMTLQLARVDAAIQETSATTEKNASAEEPAETDTQGIPEVLVRGQRSLNTDIKRSEDSPQPYVVFGREEIQRSQAVSIEDFLRTRLPMNSSSGSVAQGTGTPNNYSFINLRGLGGDETLVLVDGRRIPGISYFGGGQQPDVNGIPISSIERIEVLPSTASGIYGGNATGGVINIILRRDYQGLEANATYNNTFDTDTGSVRLDGNAGFSLEGGKTQVLMSFAYSQSNNLTIGDRDFHTRSRQMQKDNNPNVAAWTTATTPPLGATVNIRSANGTPLQLDSQYSNGAVLTNSLGQPTNITHLPLGYAGPASDGGAALRANAGRYNLDLPNDINHLKRGLVSAPSMESFSVNVRREFTGWLEAFLDVAQSGNNGSSLSDAVPTTASLPASAPNNPFQQAINVSFPVPNLTAESTSESTLISATAGLIARLPGQWTSELDYAWSRSRFLTRNITAAVDGTATTAVTGVLNTGLPAADGRPALNALQEGNTYPIDWGPYLLPVPNSFTGPADSVLKSATLRLSGPVLQLWGGPLTLSGLIERRGEDLDSSISRGINTTTRASTYTFYPAKSQETDSYYLEARAPLVSRKNARPGIRELELQVSVRQDEYDLHSTSPASASINSPDGPFPTITYFDSQLRSTDYTVGLKYSPVQDVTLRGSFGTGFLPPSVRQVVAQSITPSSTTNYGPDPRRGDTPMNVVPFEVRFGSNPNLKPENSESLSAGIILTPRWAPDFRLSVDYTHIEKTDEIQGPIGLFILQNEALYPERIVRGNPRPNDPPTWAPPIIAFDISPINIAMSDVKAYDFQADYLLATDRSGTFRPYLMATLTTHYLSQTLPGNPIVESVGFTNGVLKWRGNVGMDWERGALTVGWNAQYYDSYKVYTATAIQASIDASILNQGSGTIPHQMYHDLIATYRFDGAAALAGGLFSDSHISFGIQNVFDRSPPVLAATGAPLVSYSNYGDPRLRRYTLSFRKSFGR